MRQSLVYMLHRPVLLSELISLFSHHPSPHRMLDCTFGRGGHSLALLKAFPNLLITALDRDQQALEYACSLKETKEGKIILLKKNFHHFPAEREQTETYDIILMDLGVSSPQLDEAERGFSFYRDGPLDMRMDRDQAFKADDIINTWSKKELIKLFQSYGEIKNPYKVINSIIEKRKKKKFTRTFELSHLIQKNWPRQKALGKHPATPWFLALRMIVNQELEGLKNCLPDFLPLLKDQAFFTVISFHSLEDRIVKQTFRHWKEQKKGWLFSKKALSPRLEEKKQNPRSRSAKLRVFVKGAKQP